MFVVENTQQGTTDTYEIAWYAVNALCVELDRQRDTHATLAPGSFNDLRGDWDLVRARARALLGLTQEGPRRVEEPIVFALPTGESLTLSVR